jgi:DNA-binding SARP family transcriptional activator
MFEVLGGVRAIGPDGPLDLQPQVRRVLGILLADRDAPVPVERLIDRLWGDHPPATAGKVVHVSLGRLRAALEPGLARGADSSLIVTAADGYALKAGALDLDAY